MLSAADLLAPIGFDMFRKRSASGNVHELDPNFSITLSPSVIASGERGTGRQIPSSRERGVHSAFRGRYNSALS